MKNVTAVPVEVQHSTPNRSILSTQADEFLRRAATQPFAIESLPTIAVAAFERLEKAFAPLVGTSAVKAVTL
jgi:hypothetical protein